MLVTALLLVSLLPLPAVMAQVSGADGPPTYLLGNDLSTNALDEPAAPVDVPDIKEVIQGRQAGERFGGQLAGVGNLDHKNGDDFAVLLPSRGHCVVFFGDDPIRESPVHPLKGTEYTLSPQSQVRPAGDINLDFFDDMVITSPDMYVDGKRAAGAVFIFKGSPPPTGPGEAPDHVLLGSTKDLRLGSDVDSGDISGDGYPDLIVGADGWRDDTGQVRLYLGSDSGLQEHPALVLEGEAPGDRFGHAVTGAGDLNGDGYMDFAVGAPFATSGEGKGRVYVYYGGKDLSDIRAGPVMYGRMLKSYFGLSIRLAGDVNDDGFSDLLISAPKEPSGSHIDAGKVELYMGSEQGIQTDPSWMFDGESDDARLGFNIAFLGDINRDDMDDVAIGAPTHSSEGRSERGKFYVFLGDEDGFRKEPSVVEEGRYAGDMLSKGLAGAGDVDGDGYRDVLVGVPGVDTGAGIDTGEVQIYRGSDLTMPPLQGDAFEVMDAEPGDLALVEHRHYQVRMSVTHRTGISALRHVDLHLDPQGEDVVFRFVEVSHNLVEVRDEDDLADGYVVRVLDSTTHKDTWDVIIGFKLHWGFPTGSPLSVRIVARDDLSLQRTGRWADTVLPVDRLTFSGPVTVSASVQGEVASGDWVSSGEVLTFSGATVEYDLSAYGGAPHTRYRPPSGRVVVVIRDDTGGEWSVPSSQVEPFTIRVVTPPGSRPDMSYTASIETPDRSKVFHTQQMTLHVDGTEVSFRDPEPSSTIASKWFTPRITVEDPLGRDLDLSTSVQYRVNRAGDGKGFSSWTEAYVSSGPDGSVVAEVPELFTEGTNYVMWRAWDHVGNGPTESMIFPIVVDLGNITFTSPLPTEGKWHSTDKVVVGITIENTQGNPIDLAHLWYRTSTSPGEYSPWIRFQTTVPPGGDPSRVTVTLNVELSEGDDNLIQWRARAREHPEYTTSSLYRVLVDLTGPRFTEASPAEDEFVNSRDVTINVVVEDALSGLMDGSVLYQVLDENEWHRPLSVTHRGEELEFTARVSVKEGVDNYIRWQARDQVGHLSELFYQQVKVDVTPPMFSNFLPAPGTVVDSRFVEVGVRVSDPGPQDPAKGVDLRTLEYTVHRPRSGQSPWRSPDIGFPDPVVPFEDTGFHIEVEDGVNEIIWRVNDTASPRANLAMSEPIRIVADLPDAGVDRPPVIIRSEPVGILHQVTDLIRFDASQSYHPLGERLSFVWTSDVDGVIGTSPTFSTHLSSGPHTITIRVTALESGATSEAVFHVSVESPEETQHPFSAWWEQLALVLIVVFVAVTLLLQRFRIKEWDL